MAKVETDVNCGQVEISLVLTVDEVDVVMGNWDIPLNIKSALLRAKKAAEQLQEQE